MSQGPCAVSEACLPAAVDMNCLLVIHAEQQQQQQQQQPAVKWRLSSAQDVG
jgi:hypothetical protein